MSQDEHSVEQDPLEPSDESNETTDESSDPVSQAQVSEELLNTLNRGFRRKRSLLRRPNANISQMASKDKNRVDDEPVSVTPQPVVQKREERLPKNHVEIERPKLSIETIPTWLRAMKSIELMLLPYTEVPYTHDVYEQALFVLYRRHWRIFSIWFLNYVLLGPIYWSSLFGGYKTFNWKIGLFRWSVMLALPFGFTKGVAALLTYISYQDLVLPFQVIGISAYVIFHFIGCHDGFKPWRTAYQMMQDQFQNTFFRKKNKK